MITYRKYIQEKINEGTMKEIIKTTLEAKLRFKKETSAVYKENVRERICSKSTNLKYNQKTLPDYLIEAEGIVYNENLGIYEDGDIIKRRMISIREKPRRLGIDIGITSFSNLKPEEMLNLEGLNEFVKETS
jgi:hypothetical protein